MSYLLSVNDLKLKIKADVSHEYLVGLGIGIASCNNAVLGQSERNAVGGVVALSENALNDCAVFGNFGSKGGRERSEC
jgi:hypothetical protein